MNTNPVASGRWNSGNYRNDLKSVQFDEDLSWRRSFPHLACRTCPFACEGCWGSRVESGEDSGFHWRNCFDSLRGFSKFLESKPIESDDICWSMILRPIEGSSSVEGSHMSREEGRLVIVECKRIKFHSPGFLHFAGEEKFQRKLRFFSLGQRLCFPGKFPQTPLRRSFLEQTLDVHRYQVYLSEDSDRSQLRFFSLFSFLHRMVSQFSNLILPSLLLLPSSQQISFSPP